MAARGSGRSSGRGAILGALIAGGPFLLGSAGPARGQGYALWTFNGTAPLDELGRAVAGVGDVNGDGSDDVLVGAPGFVFGYLPLGPGFAKVFSGATGLELLSFNGAPGSTDGLGYSVAGPGDLDGDGVPDVVLGVPGADVVGVANAGEVRAFSGAGGALLFSLGGGTTNGRLGFTLANLGDVSGDGVPDLLAGEFDTNVRIVSGSGGGLLGSVTVPGYVSSLSGVGDVDGDSIPDFIIGIENLSQAWVYAGGNLSLLYPLSSLSATDLFGSAVAGAGDVDDDGTPDIIVGARQAFPPGYAQVFSGVSGLLLFTVSGSGFLGQFGATVAGAGDLNGDGFADVAVGSPSAAPAVRTYAGPGGVPFLTFIDPAATGRAIAPAGDANADGIPDLVVGSGTGMGEAEILSLVGIPSGSSTFGVPCAGTGGFSPRISTFGGTPSVGNSSFGFSVSRGPGGAAAVLFLGTIPNAGGSPLGGCLQHLDGLIFPVALVTLAGPAGVGGAGYRLVGVPVPANPGLVGLTFHFHWAILDPASANGLFTTSDAISVTVL